MRLLKKLIGNHRKPTVNHFIIERKIKRTLVYAFLIVGLIITLMPFFWMLSTSLKVKSGIFSMPPQWIPKEITFSHYIKLFTQANFFRFFLNSFIIAISVTVSSTFINSLAGFAFAKYRFPGRDHIFAILVIALMVPPQVTMIPNFLILKKLGMINSYLGLIVPATASVFAIFLIRQFVYAIPNSLIESARIDGCSEFGIYWRIILPLCKPVLATLAILTFMSSWNSFLWPLVIMIREDMYTLPVALANLNGQYTTEYGLLMAGAVVVVIPVIIVFLAAQKYIIEGISTTGIKG